MLELNSNSRTKNTIINVSTGIGGKIVILAFAFAVRTVFIRQFGAEYNGLNSLINNILSFLCLADIGLQSVLNYSLYACVVRNDVDGILKNLKAFRRVYGVFALVIAAGGGILIPVLPTIIKSSIPLGEIYVYYLLYLANSIATYLWIYKTILLYADQNQHIINIGTLVSRVFTYSLQIVAIYLWKNMYVYLIIQIVFTVLQNLVLSRIAEKKYSFLEKLKETDTIQIEEGQKRNIIATIKYRLSDVLLNNTDSIIISALLGTLFSGYYANYYMLFQYVEGVVYVGGTGIIASIGNLAQKQDSNSSYRNFKSLSLIYAVTAAVCATCFYNCTQAFIPIWIGREYNLPDSFLIMMIACFYLNISMSTVRLYREAMGLFTKVPGMMFAAAVLNITLSIFLGLKLGLIGVVMATFVAKSLTQYWYEPYLLFQMKFKASIWIYHKTQLVNLVLSIISIMISGFICKSLGDGIFCLIVKGAISVIICLSVFYTYYRKTMEVRDIFVRVKPFLRRDKNDT